MELSKKIKSILILDFFFFLICLLGVFYLYEKAALPFNVIHSGDVISVVDSKILRDVPSGSSLISIDSIQITSLEDIEFLLDAREVGDSVIVSFSYDENPAATVAVLVRFYNTFQVLAALLTGMIFIFFGIFVLIKCHANSVSLLFHFLTCCVAGIIMLSWGKYENTVLYSGYITRILFHLLYILAPAMFLHFALMFPVDRTAGKASLIKSWYIVSLLFAVIVNIFFISAALDKSFSNIDAFVKSFGFLRLYIIIGVIAGISVFIYSFLTAESETDRKKLKWIISGFIIGPVSFILFWVLPQLLNVSELLPEEIIILLSNAVPLTFSISIVKYHLFDIDQIIKRSIVYLIVIAILILLYASLILSLFYLLNLHQSTFIAAIAAVVVGLLFSPVKDRVQSFVDIRFFRVKYDFRQAVSRILTSLKEFNQVNTLFEFLVDEINSLIPADKIGIFRIDQFRGSLVLLAERNLSVLLKNEISLNPVKLASLSRDVIGLPDKIEREASFTDTFDAMLKRYGLAVAVPIVSNTTMHYGLVVIGNKKSGRRFTVEDLDLLRSIASTAADTIDRILLQEELIRERIAAENMEELNKQKSLYVSAVTHDLKVPLTSIKLFTELLLGDKTALNDQVKRHLNVIDNETNRLSRLVTNILDISKIERGDKKYQIGNLDLNSIVQEVIELFERQLRNESFALNTHLSASAINVAADPDAIMQAVQNLIHNSIRYSEERKEITVETFIEGSFGCVSVRDRGRGIKPEHIDKIFNPYFRADSDDKGVGLGLYIVKHIMDAHSGNVAVISKPDEGTTVTLSFPLTTIKGGEYAEYSG